MSASLAYMLDTNILSDLVRNPQGVIAAQISKAGEDTVCTSVIVAAELRYGATIVKLYKTCGTHQPDPLRTGNPAAGNTR